MSKNRFGLKPLLGPSVVAITLKPLLALDLHELNQIHKALIKAHKQARRASEAAYIAYREAGQTTVEAYSALASFESELQHFQEKHKLSAMEQFKLITTEDDESDLEGA